MGFYQGDGNDSDTTAFNDKYIKDQKFAKAPFWGLFPKLKDMDDRDDTLFPLPFKFNFRDFGDNAFAMASGIPTVKQFDKCQELNGLSAWTAQGIWKCLVPGKAISPLPKLDFLLPLEDVQSDKSHSRGLFFNDFNLFLKWRSHMNKLQQQRIKTRSTAVNPAARTPEDLMLSWDDLHLGNDAEYVSAGGSKNIIGRAQSISTTKDSSDAKPCTVKTEKIYFDDGTADVTTTTTSEGSTPTVKHEVVSVDEDK
ncbi:Mpm1p [Saccharomyces cerevisiae x Saccharomyces kudriavzevii VIN7]|uniref:Mpm1p n=1 Tax=Saccharomyces cerevisiae x Saccharomyces kudriavzevii (strain VIN7) TaxID=1095631 RepID=H0GWT1_SACCK|nr:Mpm1p [Saccharomyces cerevisiae x Saccharomyces kudriavzevii VIN7]